MPEPVLPDGDVLVEIHAAGLNPLDVKIRDGAFKPVLPYHPPFVLGHDMAGVVARVGAIRPIMDRVFPFAATNEALAYAETGRSKGKVVITLK
jgi:NADPH:quinone reductase-like Zn-dependent oxidoreductase